MTNQEKIHQSELYCRIHRIKLIHLRIIAMDTDLKLEVGYCSKCRKEYTELTDISPVYISNYEWLYDDYDKEGYDQNK